MNTTKFCYEYPRPAITTDCVVFGLDGLEINVLLIERGSEPFKGKWAFPGGFLEINESAEDCAKRELLEETGIHNIYLEQLHTFTSINRDPRGRVISIVYFALVNISDYQLLAGDDATKVKWHKLNNIPPLAFDHELILKMAKEKIKYNAKQ